MRAIAVSIRRILAFLGVWAALTSAAVLAAVGLGGEEFYEKLPFRVGLEIVLTFAVLAALVFMARVVDRRPLRTIGFTPSRLPDLLGGVVLGAAILALPLALLVLMGAAQIAPDLSAFTPQALAIGLFVCFFNVVTQETLARGYIFQELWGKYGAAPAAIVTTLFFLAIHAAPILKGSQGLIAGANILLASIMLCIACARTGALWLAIGIHLGWNGLQGPVLGLNVTGLDLAFGSWRVFTFSGAPLLTGGDMGVEGGLVGLIGPAVGIVLVALLVKQQPKPDFTGRPRPARPNARKGRPATATKQGVDG
ncbi:MAG: CPBP family intramembrane metalloprotease [Hyphomonadaceae bacterium]|nr:CPBP family intramembrane metalloprotease [Hyphomonadaceae bacterium]